MILTDQHRKNARRELETIRQLVSPRPMAPLSRIGSAHRCRQNSLSKFRVRAVGLEPTRPASPPPGQNSAKKSYPKRRANLSGQARKVSYYVDVASGWRRQFFTRVFVGT